MSFNSDDIRTSNDHEQQQLCCTENSDVNIYENNAGDSNVARGGVLHNIHDGYDNIKDNEINNGNDDRDRNNERDYDNRNKKINKDCNNDENHNAIGEYSSDINNTDDRSHSHDSSSRFSHGSMDKNKSDDNCNRKEASVPIKKSNVSKTNVQCENPLNRPRRPPRAQTWLETLMYRDDYDALDKKRRARYYRGQDEDEETVQENYRPEYNQQNDIPLDISTFNEEPINANDGSAHRTIHELTEQLLTNEIQLSFDEFECNHNDLNKELHEFNEEGTGIWCARKCAIDQTPPCFNFSMVKSCDHSIDRFMLNTLGDYVIFQANCFHRGYFYIQLSSIYYTAQMFATPTGNTSQRSLLTSRSAKVDTMNCKELRELSTDIRKHWKCEEKYMNVTFKPPKKFDGENIDPDFHRVIKRRDFEQLKYPYKFVSYFESNNTNFQIDKVWIMAKSKKESGFQKWHTDKLNGITTTIVVNLGIES